MSKITANKYQIEALKTATYGSKYKILYPALGLGGEAGEVMNKVKKIIRDDKGKLTKKRALAIAEELGDVAWYLAVLSHEIGYELGDVMEMNIKKLRSRQQRGKINGEGDNR
jgi:NTP pyrophosphatase (non-canonical NTP hydrolase)